MVRFGRDLNRRCESADAEEDLNRIKPAMSRIGNPYSVSIAASVSSLRHAIGGLRFVPLTPFHHFLYLNIFICLLRRRYLEKSEEIEHRDRGKVSQEEKPSLVRSIGAPGLIAPPPLRPGIRRWRALAVGNLSSSSGLRKRKIGRSRLAISYCTGVSISCWYDTYLAVLSYTEHTDTWYTKVPSYTERIGPISDWYVLSILSGTI
ncbi:hypothetical protein BHE74_00040174 [Ensete ventricosum]|nr:hypothetical protein BHE74_00040174 [Ensete ventricosum]